MDRRTTRCSSALLLCAALLSTLVVFVARAERAGADTGTFTNATAIPVTDRSCTGGTPPSPPPCDPGKGNPYPSTVAVSGLAGVVSKVTATLTGVTHAFTGDFDVLLVAPNGANLILLADGAQASVTNHTITFDDAAATSLAVGGGWPASPATSKPVDHDAGLDYEEQFPAPAVGPFAEPAPAGIATFASQFNGINPNGTWSLFVVDDGLGDSGTIGGGWSLNVTTVVGASTSTTVGSSLNPSRTGQSVTFSATVTSAGSPVTTGAVTFTEGVTTLAANVAVNGSGVASFSTSTLTEGNHLITASYGGTAAFGPSSGSVTQTVDNNTVVTGTTFCNTGAITLSASAIPGAPYPSRVFVTGLPTSTVSLTATLKSMSHTFPDDIDVLLVGPTGAALLLLADAGGDPDLANHTVTFSDAAAGLAPNGTSFGASPLTFRPTDHDDGLDTADAFPLPAPAVFSTPAPAGTATLASVFANTNPNGTWSLYVVDDAGGDGGSIAGGWCLDITAAEPDIIPPSVTVNQAAGQADPTSTSPINFTVVFSESVTGFATGDVTLGGTAGATTAVVTGSGTTYNVAVSGMAGSGPVVASVPAGAAADGAGNASLVSTSTDNSVTFDNVAPSVTVNQAAGQADPTSSSPINFAVVFSEPVTGFVNADVVLSGTAGATTVVVTGSGATYNVAVSGMTVLGTVTVTVPAGAAVDAASNASLAATFTDNTVTFNPDSTPPSVTLERAAGQADPTNASPVNFTVVFSEPVTGFVSGDVTVGGTAGATTAVVTGSGATYNVAVSGMTGPGTVVASLAAGVAADGAGNASLASTSLDNSVVFDNVRPDVSVAVAAGQADPTSASPVNFTVTFSEPVTDFVTGDVALGGGAGATTAVVTGSGATYNVAVSGMTGAGSVTVSVSANVAVDAAGNLNTASNAATVAFQLSLSIGDVSVVEGDQGSKVATFTVTLSAPSPTAVTVEVTTAAGTASANDFFDPNPFLRMFGIGGPVRIPAGQTTGTYSVNVTGDFRFEPDETVIASLSLASGATIGDGTGVLSILNDDHVVEVSGLAPNNGTSSGGTQVTIVGQNLNQATAVAIGGVAVPFSVSGNDLIFTTPGGLPGDVFVVVTGPDGNSKTHPGSTFTYI
ncbi:MAG: beta strand repeat-containing protein [Acidimicrobiia bacterium]